MLAGFSIFVFLIRIRAGWRLCEGRKGGWWGSRSRFIGGKSIRESTENMRDANDDRGARTGVKVCKYHGIHTYLYVYVQETRSICEPTVNEGVTGGKKTSM